MASFGIIYWSGTGNTEAIADILKDEFIKSNHKAEVITVSKANESVVNDYDVLVLGCPAMGAEELEDSEMQPFIEAIKPLINDKKIALFGSYGWGEGEWIKLWHNDMLKANARLFGEDLAINGYPDGEKSAVCSEFAQKLCSF